LPNPLKAKLKKKDGKVLVAQVSDFDPDDVVGVVGVAQLKLVKNGKVVQYDYNGDSHKCLMAKVVIDDEKDDSSKCLMAKESKVPSTCNPLLFNPKPPINIFHDVEGGND
jgi:hypothetical protein